MPLSTLKIVFKSLGFQVKRIPNPGKSSGHPLFIEFIGPPCVGKTTYMNKLIIYSQPSKITDASKFGFEYNSNSILKDYHREIMSQRLMKLHNSAIDSFHYFQLLQYFSSKIINDANLSNSKHTTVNDEGLFQLFTDEFISLEHSKPAIFKTALENRAVILLQAEPEVIYQQILKRANDTSQILPEHKKNWKETIEMTEISMKSKEKLYEILKSHDLPVLKLNIATGFSNNLEEINAFVKKIINHAIAKTL